jgi:DNA-binding MarR family transcriptional regulator
MANDGGAAPEDLGLLGRRLSTAIVLYHTALAERLGLNLTDFKCLDLLIRRGEAASPGQLSMDAGLSSATTTLVLDRLEATGLIRRIADPVDRRRTAIQVSLGPELIADFGDATRGMRSRMTALAAAFSPTELEAIGRYLDLAATAIEASLGEMRLDGAPRRSPVGLGRQNR